jgi:transcriptional regulator with XRE-family HTH domain
MKPGHEQFKDWLDRRFPNSDRKSRDAAELFGWDETFISKLVRGDRSPGLANADTIEAITGISHRAWLPSAVDKSSQPVAASAGRRRS